MSKSIKMQDLIEHALSPDSDKRKHAETQILEYQSTNFLDFISSLISILSGNDTPQVRFTSGVILKNSLITTNTEQNMHIASVYRNLKHDQKVGHRRMLIGNFSCVHTNIGTISASVLGCLAKLDMDCGDWSTFVDEMYELLNSSESKVVLNALTAVTVNCQHATIAQPNKVYAMYMYYLRADAQKELLVHNLVCLLEIQEKMAAYIITKANELMNKLFLLANADVEVVEHSLLNINRLITYAVESVDIRKVNMYMKGFMHKKEDELRMQSIEYFIKVVEKEMMNNKDYLGEMLYEILNNMFVAIVKGEEYEDEEWNIHKAATYCINLLGTKHNLIQNKNIQNYIMQKLTCADQSKDDGIIVLGAILNFSFYSDDVLKTENVYVKDFIHDNDTSHFIKDTVKHIIKAIKTSDMNNNINNNNINNNNNNINNNIKKSALWTLARICETNFQNVDAAADLPEVIDVCEVILQMKVKESVNAAWVLSNMCNSMSKLVQMDKETNNLTFFYCPMVDILVSISDTVGYKEHALRNATYSALTAAIRVCANETRLLLDKLWAYYTKKITEAVHYSMKVSEDQFNIIEDYVSSYLYVLQAIFLKKGEAGMGEKKNEFLGILIGILSIQRQTILYEDVYSCISSTCVDSKSFFVNKVRFYINFMLRDLASNYKGVLISNITLIGDIVCALGPGSIEYANAFIRGLIGCLTSAHITREVKPLIINTFGDMALSLGLSFETYIDMCFSFIPQVISIKHSFDEDFVDDLRGSVLNMLKCFILGMENSERILSNVSSIGQVIKVICSEDRRQRNAINCIKICGDFITTFGKSEQDAWMVAFVRQFVNSEKYRAVAMSVLEDMGRASER